MGSQGLAVEFILNKNVTSSMNSNSVTHLKFMFSVLVCAVFNSCLSVCSTAVFQSWFGQYVTLLQTLPLVPVSLWFSQGCHMCSCHVTWQRSAILLEPQNVSQITSDLKIILCWWPTWEINCLFEQASLLWRKLIISDRDEQQLCNV
jgi:hypothetical protein